MRHFSDDDDEDDLDEASLLESPLDKIEPYGLFKNVLMSMICARPFSHSNLTMLMLTLFKIFNTNNRICTRI